MPKRPQWFHHAADGMPNFGQGLGWTPASWRRAPRKQVPVGKLVSTNRRGYLSERRAARYARTGGADIYVVEHAGRYYIADGHHRAVAAMMRGDTTIAARVKRAGDRT
jgi:ParB-like nuclease family protein